MHEPFTPFEVNISAKMLENAARGCFFIKCDRAISIETYFGKCISGQEILEQQCNELQHLMNL